MNSKNNRQSDFVLPDGTHLNIKIGIDANGTPVISSLHFHFPSNNVIPPGGISASTLREVKFEDLYVEYYKHAEASKSSTYERKLIIKYLKKSQQAQGRIIHPPEYFAAISYLYLEQFKLTPKDPTNQLAALLNLPKRTVLYQLATARKMGLLSQNSPDGPSGRAGGSLTEEGVQLLKQFPLELLK